MAPARHILLIGVDHYLDNSLGYGNLYGCVRDIERVEAFLRRSLNIQDSEIRKLTALHQSQDQSQDQSQGNTTLPTHENITSAFKQLIEQAAQDDLVYIHYSGHGGRAITSEPKIKGENAQDEGLVPVDIGNSDANYFRDYELAYYCDQLVKKGAILTVVLDCCHSGGMRRGQGSARKRGSDILDTTPRPKPAYGIPDEALAAFMQRPRAAKRNASFGNGTVPAPEGYSLVTACRSTESAWEDVFEGNESEGALTWGWLKSLEAGAPTFEAAFDRVEAEIKRRFDDQNPQYYGDKGRAIFGKDHINKRYSVLVQDVDTSKKRVKVEAGQATGLEAGAKFAIFPNGTGDFSQLDKRIALVTVNEIEATTSWAVAENDGDAIATIKAGDVAVLDSAPSVQLKQRVTLTQRTELPGSIDQSTPLSRLKANIEASSWLNLTATDGALQVVVNDKGEYEIWDSQNKALPNMGDSILIAADNAPKRIVARLEHLARYFAVKGLYNYDTESKLAKAVKVDVVGVQHDYVRGSMPNPIPIVPVDNKYALQTGDTLFVEVSNLTATPLNLTAIALQSDWSIDQIYPLDTNFTTIEKGVPEKVNLAFYLPDKVEGGVDTLKLFVTTSASDFHWLTLPSLDSQFRSKGEFRDRKGSLEQLMSALTADKVTRNVIPVTSPSDDWIIHEIAVSVQRAAPTDPPKSEEEGAESTSATTTQPDQGNHDASADGQPVNKQEVTAVATDEKSATTSGANGAHMGGAPLLFPLPAPPLSPEIITGDNPLLPDQPLIGRRRGATAQKIGLDGNAPINAGGLLADRFQNAQLFVDAGVSWVRVNFIRGPWSNLFDQTRIQGKTWRDTYHTLMDTLRRRNLRVYGLIGHEAVAESPGDQFRDSPGSPAPTQWIRNYAQTFVGILNEFAADLTVVESFNEPDDWKGQQRNWIHPYWYAILLQEVHDRVREQPGLNHIKLVSGPLQGLENNGNGAANYLNSAYQYGRQNLGWGSARPFPFDGVGYHLYIASSPANPAVDIPKAYRGYMDQMRSVILSNEGQNKPIYISEIGWTSDIGADRQAECMRVGLQELLQDPSVAIGIWFCAQDFEKRYGVLDTSGQAKPALAALSALAHVSGNVPIAEVQPVLSTAPVDAATYISDSDWVKDGSDVSANLQFVQRWQFKNTGTSVWGPGYALANCGGSLIGAEPRIAVPACKPGETAEVFVSYTTPNMAGALESDWKMVNADGQPFGDRVWTKINVVGPQPLPKGAQGPIQRAPLVLIPESDRQPAAGVPVTETNQAKTTPDETTERYIKIANEEITKAWAEQIRQGYKNNEVIFKRILEAFMTPYNSTVWMYRILFGVGIGAFVASILVGVVGSLVPRLATTTYTPLAASTILGGIGVVTFLTYFISQPLKALEQNLVFITWLGILYNSYWNRITFAQNPATFLTDLKAANTDTLDEIRLLLDAYERQSKNRPMFGDRANQSISSSTTTNGATGTSNTPGANTAAGANSTPTSHG